MKQNNSMNDRTESLDSSCYVNSERGIVIRTEAREHTVCSFTLSGFRYYSPNSSSVSGTGSDDWYFLCESEGKKGYLLFSDGAGGSFWTFAGISDKDYQSLVNCADQAKYQEKWQNLLQRARKFDQIHGLKPYFDPVVRSLLPNASRMGKLTDDRLQFRQELKRLFSTGVLQGNVDSELCLDMESGQFYHVLNTSYHVGGAYTTLPVTGSPLSLESVRKIAKKAYDDRSDDLSIIRGYLDITESDLPEDIQIKRKPYFPPQEPAEMPSERKEPQQAKPSGGIAALMQAFRQKNARSKNKDTSKSGKEPPAGQELPKQEAAPARSGADPAKLVSGLMQEYDAHPEHGILYFVDAGDPGRYHEIIALRYRKAVWELVEDYLTPEVSFQRTTPVSIRSRDALLRWMIRFVDRYEEEITKHRIDPAEGLKNLGQLSADAEMQDSPASFRALPSGYTLLRNISEETSCSGGFEYRITAVDLVCDAQCNQYQRRYKNACDSGENGRPCCTERDVLIRIPADGVITASMRLNPDIVLRDTSGNYVDTSALEYAKAHQEKNVTSGYELVLAGRRFYVLYVGIHGGSGYGANYPYNTRYYLVQKDFWSEKQGQYLMVHDSGLPKDWAYYDSHGIDLGESRDFRGSDSEVRMQLKQALSRLDADILDAYCEK